jgi:hypothetical protein
MAILSGCMSVSSTRNESGASASASAPVKVVYHVNEEMRAMNAQHRNPDGGPVGEGVVVAHAAGINPARRREGRNGAPPCDRADAQGKVDRVCPSLRRNKIDEGDRRGVARAFRRR